MKLLRSRRTAYTDHLTPPRAPLLTGADQVAYLDIDDTIKATYGYQKQGAGYGYSKIKGLNALLATCSTPCQRR